MIHGLRKLLTLNYTCRPGLLCVDSTKPKTIVRDNGVSTVVISFLCYLRPFADGNAVYNLLQTRLDYAFTISYHGDLGR